MGSFMGNATGTNNGFSANGASSLLGPNSTNLLDNLNANQANVSQLFNQQQGFGSQLQSQANGQGPNPAQMQLQQGTNRAIQQSAGMLASQRGISPAMAQRLAAQNAGVMSQQAAGQGALMGANQQLAAQGQLGSLYGQMANQQLGQQSTLQNALSAWNNNQVGMQSNMNDANGAAAAQNAHNSQGLFGGLVSGGGSAIMQGLAKGGEVKHYADGGPVLSNWGFNSQPQIRSGGAQSYVGQYLQENGGGQKSGGGSGGGGGGLGNLMNSFGGGGGGMSDDAAQEGYLDADSMLGVAGVDNAETMLPAVGGASDIGGAAAGAGAGAAGAGAAAGAAGAAGAGAAAAGGAATIAELAPLVALAANKGGQVPQKMALGGFADMPMKNMSMPMATPVQRPAPPAQVMPGMSPKMGSQFGNAPRPQMVDKNTVVPSSVAPQQPQAFPMPRFGGWGGMGGWGGFQAGGAVPGDAKVKGDSLKNDKVPAMLSPKEIVLPRSITMQPDAPQRAAEFVARVQARSRNKMPAKRSA